ncbi:PAS domain-containing protein [Ramlibacter sp. RBP-2]|uniref:PAS domain-containing protein n=1 Tax=Ramlibacter lithotrophicus TaxID=2606681 RepID=A0A7X6I8X7_9BURK|nr:PAS domain-containing protein [Ramlibacter lithotrophicus]NKE68830.1 PAS domain-containing protein [Ramlibacter lithotrophicus]
MTRALVVDDRAENRYLLRAVLQARGWAVDEAADGAQALASARATVPDIVVSDLLMPVMDGYTLLRHWEADERLRGVPFVVYTATYTDPDDERLARDLGAAAFVLKPQEPQDLLRLLDTVLERRWPAPPLATPVPAGEDHMRQYSEVLVRKLEEKTAQLERANRQLETDMAARRQAEALAESARAQLSQAFERVTDAFVALDRNWCYTYVNAKAGELFGREPAQLLGKHIWTEFPEGVGQPFHLAYERAMDEQKPLHFESYYGPYDRWFENVVYPSPNGLSIYFHDITVRKEAEAALRESEERLRLALDAAHMGTYDWDIPTGRIIWSRRHEALWGYAAGEFDGTYASFGARVHPQDLAAMNAEVSRCMVAREPFTHEFRVVWPDGSVHWIEGCGEFEFDAAGTAVRMRGVATEITARKQAQERDRQQLAELRRWHELTVGREERVAELKATVDRLLAARGLPPRFGGAAAAAADTDGACEPPAADNGRSRLALLNLLDDQRRAVEALRRSEAGLRLAQARASIGSWELDLAHASVACSDEMRRLFRCGPPAGPVPLAELAHALLPADRCALAPGGVWSLQEPRAARQQLRVRDPDGTITWIECKGETELGQDGRPVRVSGTAQDVTERQHLLERLAESNEQLRALAARMDRLREEESSRLSRELHDELGQALAGLKLDLATLHARLAADEPAAAERIRGMQAQIDGLVRTTRDIARRLRPRVLDDLGLLPALEAQAGEICRRMGARYELVSDVPNEALADPALATAVYRVVQEALTNIARHAAATRVDIAVLGQPGWLTVEVRDNGKGLAQPTHPGRATLGLLGMQERAAAVGGQVTVEGFPGQGTVVTLRVPLGTRTEAA